MGQHSSAGGGGVPERHGDPLHESGEDLGVVVTCESGCWEADGGTLQRWEGDVNVWFVGRLDGEWKILAAFFRQQGLPE